MTISSTASSSIPSPTTIPNPRPDARKINHPDALEEQAAYSSPVHESGGTPRLDRSRRERDQTRVVSERAGARDSILTAKGLAHRLSPDASPLANARTALAPTTTFISRKRTTHKAKVRGE